MKIERSDKQYGCGTGHNTYRSDIFKVTFWTHYKETKTTIEFSDSFCELEAKFDGKHDFKSDDECMAQLTSEEILSYVEYCKNSYFRKGRNSMRKDLKSLMKDD